VHACCAEPAARVEREGAHLYDDIFTPERVQQMVDLARGESARYPAANDEEEAA
jgi:hypothetical protein